MIAGVIGVVGLCFFLLYLSNSLDDNKHLIIKLLLLFSIISMMLLVPKMVIDDQTICEPVLANSTIDNNNVTINSYESFCITTGEGTGKSFLQLTQRIYFLILGYAIVFLAVWGLFTLSKAVKSKGGKR